jgi:hypothetical protein
MYDIKLSREYTLDSDPDEMEFEYNLHISQHQKKKHVDWLKAVTRNMIYGFEILNNKYDLFDLKLNGWAERMTNNLDDATTFFEELYDRYHTHFTQPLPPEIKLMMFIITDALSYHLNQSGTFKDISDRLFDQVSA